MTELARINGFRGSLQICPTEKLADDPEDECETRAGFIVVSVFSNFLDSDHSHPTTIVHDKDLKL